MLHINNKKMYLIFLSSFYNKLLEIFLLGFANDFRAEDSNGQEGTM
jgi:hypothetical protein